MPDDAAGRDDRFAKWLTWSGRIQKEIVNCHAERIVWREMVDKLDEHRPESVPFRNHYTRLYADAQAMAIRRLVDRDNEVESLTRLISEMRIDRDVMTRSRYIAMRPQDPDRAARRFDELFGDGCEHLRLDLLTGDLEELDRVSGPVRRRANHRIAHMTTKALSPMRFADIHGALEAISTTYNRYGQLLHVSDIDTVPALAYDWKAPFRQALWAAPQPVLNQSSAGPELT